MTTEPAAEPDAFAEFDIIVVGSGAAGMTAALTAAHLGATAVVLEKTGAFGAQPHFAGCVFGHARGCDFTSMRHVVRSAA